MEQEQNNGVEFTGENFNLPGDRGNRKKPKMVEIVSRLSFGLIKNESFANLILLIFAIAIFSLSIIIFLNAR